MERPKQNLTQPPDWWAAFKQQAARDGQTLSEWVGDCCRANLDDDLRATTSERVRVGRPALDK